jgi:phytoene dehydrogenase-like protein
MRILSSMLTRFTATHNGPANHCSMCAAPLKPDPDAAPEGCENLFFLMPLAPGLEDGEALREKYFDIMIDRFEQVTGSHFATPSS